MFSIAYLINTTHAYDVQYRSSFKEAKAASKALMQLNFVSEVLIYKGQIGGEVVHRATK